MAQVSGHDIMINYSWAQKDLIKKIHKQLIKAGYSVWRDEEQMSGRVFHAMAQSITDTQVVLICMSKEYEESDNCAREATFAVTTERKPIIALIVQKGYTPKGWLALMLANELRIDFSDKTKFSKGMDQLIQQLKLKHIVPGAHGKTKEVSELTSRVDDLRLPTEEGTVQDKIPSADDGNTTVLAYWNAGVQKAFSGVASAPEAVGSVTKKAVSEVKQKLNIKSD